MKFKLLKDTPTHKAGRIFCTENTLNDVYYSLGGNNSILGCPCKLVENSPEWFEPVEEFKKFLYVFASEQYTQMCDAGYSLQETFAKEEQAKAKKELMEHIYKFSEPEEGYKHYFMSIYSDKFIKGGNYHKDTDNKIKYLSGTRMNRSTTEQDREERILLLNNYINSLKQ